MTEKRFQGINDQQFNSLFSTNGFVILTSADDIDQIYYNEVNAVQNLRRSDPEGPSTTSTVYYKSVVTNVQKIPICTAGVVFGSLQKVDYIQKKVVLSCIYCQPGMYLDLIRKTCVPFPILPFYLNQADFVG